MPMMIANTWVITAGVRLHGRSRTIPAATTAMPTATIELDADDGDRVRLLVRLAARQVAQVKRDHDEQPGRLERLGRGRQP